MPACPARSARAGDDDMSTTLEVDTRIASGNGREVGTALGVAARPQPVAAERYQRMADAERGTGGEKLADFLGLFSLGLGLAEIVAPHAMARMVGVRRPGDATRLTIRLLGLREIGHGLALLSNPQPRKAAWSRVVGDAIDLALLGKVLADPENDRGLALFATANVLAVSALDVMSATQLQMQPETDAHAAAERGLQRVVRAITIGLPVEEVYAFWRDFANLPRFMRHLESVVVIDATRSRWKAKAPFGGSVEWEAEIVAEHPNESISWRSVEGSQIRNSGVVRFAPAPGGRGTEVRVELEYKPPFGKLGSKVAMLWREEPRQQVADDLRHLKQMLETGEILYSDASKKRGPHPAQPDADAPEQH